MPWVGSFSSDSFASACESFCAKTKEDARSQIVALNPSSSSSSNLGICTCYGQWPHSPLTSADFNINVTPLFPDLLDSVDGRIKGCPPPVDRSTYQSKKVWLYLL